MTKVKGGKMMSEKCKPKPVPECCECKAAAAGAWVAQGLMAFSLALIFIGGVALALFTSFEGEGMMFAIVSAMGFLWIFITSCIVALKCCEKSKKCKKY